jgi:hypothetical protein
LNNSDGPIDLDNKIENRWPIVIVANFRTGSTVLASELAKKHGVPFFLEPWQLPDSRSPHYGPNINGLQKNFYDYYWGGNKRYVLTMVPNQISGMTPYLDILRGQSYKIKLIRENIIDNIVSFYIGKMTNKWVRSPQEISVPCVVEIKKQKIESAINTITHVNFLLDTLDFTYDEIVTYESLGVMDSSEHALTLPPVNIEEIREEVKKMYNQVYIK